MATVKFSKTFRWSPPERNGQTDIEYKAGETYKKVRKAAAEAAVKAGVGQIVGEPDEPDAPDTGEPPVPEQQPAA